MTTAAFWDRVAAKYAKQPIKDQTAYEQTLDRIRVHLGTDDHVLELACGTGATALLLAPDVRQVTATDISPGMIAQAHLRLEGDENVTFAVSEPQDVVAPDGGYDVVMAQNFLHLVQDPEAVLGHVNRVLKPGGLFISKTPCLAHFNRIIRLIIPVMQAFGKAPFVKSFTIEELDATISWAGFEIIETGAYPAKPPSRFVVARKR